MEILRNLARRKLRSTLTVLGIVIGIFALTTMGAMAAEIPNASHLTITGAAHLSNLEAPERFNAIMGDFLQGLR